MKRGIAFIVGHGFFGAHSLVLAQNEKYSCEGETPALPDGHL